MLKMMLIKIFSLIVFIIVCDAQPELRILPSGDSFTRSLTSNFMFTCEIYGIGPQVVDVNLQWFDKNGVEIVDTAGPNRLLYVEKEENLPTKKLYFTHIRTEHAGTYSCTGLVEGNKQTQRVSLLLFKEITFDHAPSPQYKILHTNALIECRVSGQPIPTVFWRYRGQKIVGNSRYSQDSYGLYINDITKSDDGLYYCRAEVDADGRFAEKEISVVVYTPPSISRSILAYEGIQSQQFVLPCKAQGLPDPKYEFTKDGNTNPIYSTDRVQYDPDAGELTFRPLHEEDAGRYTCRSYNDAGQDHVDFNLTVLVPPGVYSLVNVTGEENKTAKLVCLSYGDPAPAMAFRKTDRSSDFVMGDNDQGRIKMTNPVKGTLELVITKLVPEDMSNYTCKSTNKAGYHERNGTITVNFSPRFLPDNVRLVYIWPGKMRNMTCATLAEPVPVFEWMRFTTFPYPLFNNETFRIYTMSKNSNLQVTAREIDQNWLYGNYICRARNQYGQADLQIELRKAELPGPPSSAYCTEITSDYVRLKAELPLNNGGLEVIQYRIDFEMKILITNVGEDILIEGLRPSTTFLFRVRAISEVGAGEPLTLHCTTLDVRVPEKIVITSDIEGRYPYEYMITWFKPKTGGRPIVEYEFRYRLVAYGTRPEDNVNAQGDWVSLRKADDEQRPLMFYNLNKLRQKSTYQLEMRARNDLGWSDPNNPFFFTTAASYDIYDPDEEGLTDGSHRFSCIYSLLVLCSVVGAIISRTL